MSVIDILFRVDEICKKYDKYDIEKKRELNAYGDDAFARLYASVDSDTEDVLAKAELALLENNRAAAVAMFAEIWRTKARLINEIPKLQKLVAKKAARRGTFRSFGPGILYKWRAEILWHRLSIEYLGQRISSQKREQKQQTETIEQETQKQKAKTSMRFGGFWPWT